MHVNEYNYTYSYTRLHILLTSDMGMELSGNSTVFVGGIIAVASLIAIQIFRLIFIVGTPCKSKEKMNEKTVIITGANTGIGKETAMDLATRGARVIIACRDEGKAQAALKDIKERSGSNSVVFKKLDLASLASVRKFASEILQEEDRLDVLVNNAGVMWTPHLLTEDGFELQFGVNHLGHFLLTMLLLDRIKETPNSRIVNVSSHGHYGGSLDFDDMMWEKKPYSWSFAYFRSKLANVMFTSELARRLAGTGVTVYSLHPGSISTELDRYLLRGWRSIFRVSYYIYTQSQHDIYAYDIYACGLLQFFSLSSAGYFCSTKQLYMNSENVHRFGMCNPTCTICIT